jgi:hypothetical protein
MKLILGFICVLGCICSLSPAAEPLSSHPWRGPFGLDRIGATARQQGIEAEAVARPGQILNPVDLGTILVPNDWLLLGGKQSAHVTVAAISHDRSEADARIRAWFARQPDKAVSKPFSLTANKRIEVSLVLDSIPPDVDRDDLRVAIERADGTVIWEKTIPTMLVHSPPAWPRFGAVTTKLRYDAPISVRHEDGHFSTLDYTKGWDASFNDVVVCLPGGERFVFWRGSCYIPFWAGRHNTGLSYEWAETKPPADGFKDCVEPLMDKELRYSRVEIIESTSSRIHVRWTYQSCDFNYKIWGDAATEDFYFYPDGFGSRVLTLQSALNSEYELSEFIILTPPGAYPFNVLPTNLVDILFLDGEQRKIEFPYDPARQGAKLKSRDMTAVYRARLHKDDDATAIYFHPTDRQLPPVVFAGFIDHGQVVTPCYWGSHWPLGRGQTTGGAIDGRIQSTPSHNSVMSWAMQQPEPLREAHLETLDTLGRAKPMRRQTWAWLIGLTNSPDARLLEWAKSFSGPPALEMTGARLAAEPFVLERRAMGIEAKSDDIVLTMRPSQVCVNPVFDIAKGAEKLREVRFNGAILPPDQWTWDGKTLWVEATFTQAATLQLRFAR